MRARRLRGNVLLTAIFVAILLFFLAVALVTLNRQDITLTLSVDHRLRSQMAAMAGTNFVLETMRSTADWETTLGQGLKGKMESGATFTGVVKPFEDPDGTTYLKEISVVGTSGFISADHRTVVEEFEMGRNLAEGLTPLFFAYTDDGGLAMMDSSFKWKVLGSPPREGAFLAADSGPLFTYATAGSAAPMPELKDWRSPGLDANGILQTPVEVPAQFLDKPPDEHLLVLTFTEGFTSWTDIADPGPELGKTHSESKVDNVVGGEPQFETVVVRGEPVTFAKSEYTGASFEWYGIVGPALAARGNQVFCHAIHYVYQGARLKNNVTVVNGQIVSNPTIEEPKAYKMPAVLMYDLTTRKWTKVMDSMKVTGPHSLPIITQGPNADPRSLAVHQNSVVALKDNDPKQILKAGNDRWNDNGNTAGLSLGLYSFRNELLFHQNLTEGVALGTLQPSELNRKQPAVTAEVPVDALVTPSASNQAVTVLFANDVVSPEGKTTVKKLRVEQEWRLHMLGAGSAPALGSSPFGNSSKLIRSLDEGGNPFIKFEGYKSLSEGGNPPIPFVGYNNIEQGGNPPLPFGNGLVKTPTTEAINSSTPGGAANVNAETRSHGANVVGLSSGNLYLFAQVQQSAENATPHKENAILHFDGLHWQAWPSGMYQMRRRGLNDVDGAVVVNDNIRLSTEHLAVALYRSKSKPFRRYVPITDIGE